MKKFILAIIAVLFTVSAEAQTIDFTYQGWSSQSGRNNISLYIARDGFKLGSAFNDQNYPVWYVENQEIDVISGVINYRLKDINLDSLVKYRGDLYLYVAINGTPHDTIIMDPAPYAGTSIMSDRARHSSTSDRASLTDRALRADSSVHAIIADSSKNAHNSVNAKESVHAQRADSALHSMESNHSVRSDVSLYASSSAHSVWSDSAKVALNAIRSNFSDRSTLAEMSMIADSADRARFSTTSASATRSSIADSSAVSTNTHFVYANGVNLASIAATGAENNAILVTNGTSLQWKSSTRIEGRIQLTLVPLTTIDNDVRTLIYRVAQDFSTPLPVAVEGRIITIVNSSTANNVSIQAGTWNIWGGDIIIGPRNSATLLYTNGQWVVIGQ